SRSSSLLVGFLLLRNRFGDSSPQFSQKSASLIITWGKCQRLSQCPDCFRMVPSAIGREPEIAHQVGYFGIPSFRFLVVSESYGILLLHCFDRGQIIEGAAQNRTQESFLAAACLSSTWVSLACESALLPSGVAASLPAPPRGTGGSFCGRLGTSAEETPDPPGSPMPLPSWLSARMFC